MYIIHGLHSHVDDVNSYNIHIKGISASAILLENIYVTSQYKILILEFKL